MLHSDSLADKDISALSDAQKKQYLFQRQKQLLDDFLQHGAITKAQYDKSLGDLTVKMGIK